MALRKFTSEFKVVFDSVVEQRRRSDDDCFVYNIKRGQNTLQSSGKAVEYGIGPV